MPSKFSGAGSAGISSAERLDEPLSVFDKGEPGSRSSVPADSYAIRGWNDSGTYYILGSYGPNNTGTTNTGQVPIAGDNIQVQP